MIHIDAERNIAEWHGSGLDLMAECAGVIAESLWNHEQEHAEEFDGRGHREETIKLMSLTITEMIKMFMDEMDKEGDEDEAKEKDAEERDRETIQTRITQFRR